MEREIDAFIRYLAVEKELPGAYQSSVRQSLEIERPWMAIMERTSGAASGATIFT